MIVIRVVRAKTRPTQEGASERTSDKMSNNNNRILVPVRIFTASLTSKYKTRSHFSTLRIHFSTYHKDKQKSPHKQLCSLVNDKQAAC